MHEAEDLEPGADAPRPAGHLGPLIRGVGIALVSGLVLTAGAALQNRAEFRDRALWPPPGERFSAGDTRLHLHCQAKLRRPQQVGPVGPGDAPVPAPELEPDPPLVIVVADAGQWSVHGEPFARALHPHASVCLYDRAGLGDSEDGPQAVKTAATRLVKLIKSAELEPGDAPMVFVGEGYGGRVARLVRAQIKPRAPFWWLQAGPAPSAARVGFGKALALFSFHRLWPSGAPRLDLSPAGQERLRGGEAQTRWFSTVEAELEAHARPLETVGSVSTGPWTAVLREENGGSLRAWCEADPACLHQTLLSENSLFAERAAEVAAFLIDSDFGRDAS